MKTIFDLVKDITYNKVPWEDQTETDQKQMSPFMFNRIMSMDYDSIELVNELQVYTPVLSPGQVYTMYSDLLPKKRVYNKYINPKRNINQELVQFIVTTQKVPSDEAERWLDFLERSGRTAELKDEIKKYGLTDKEIKQKYKI
jgi:hypothetical protein